MRSALTLLVLAALAAPTTALAGGWATVKLSSTPKGVEAGTPWLVDLTVLQHGETPLSYVRPTVTIRQAAKAIVFRARPTARVGVYRARVVFPTAGTWRYEVYDGFVQYGGARVHRFAPVRVGAASQ